MSQIKEVEVPQHPIKQNQPKDKVPARGHQDTMIRSPGQIPPQRREKTEEGHKQYHTYVEDQEKEDKKDTAGHQIKSKQCNAKKQ